jgi:hypothetical protein
MQRQIINLSFFSIGGTGTASKRSFSAFKEDDTSPTATHESTAIVLAGLAQQNEEVQFERKKQKKSEFGLLFEGQNTWMEQLPEPPVEEIDTLPKHEDDELAAGRRAFPLSPI